MKECKICVIIAAVIQMHDIVALASPSKSVAQTRQSTIAKFVEATKQNLQEWKKVEESWSERLQKLSECKDFVMKFQSDEAKGGIGKVIYR